MPRRHSHRAINHTVLLPSPGNNPSPPGHLLGPCPQRELQGPKTFCVSSSTLPWTPAKTDFKEYWQPHLEHIVKQNTEQ